MTNEMKEEMESFPVDRPIDALKKDHELVKKLAQSYFNSESDEVKIRAAEQILMLLETHALLEEGAFYPAVRDMSPETIAHFEDQHHQVDEMLAELKQKGLDSADSIPMFEQVMEMMMQHIQEEEEKLFPQLEKADMDMTQLGLRMQAYEANLVHTQARATQQAARQ